MVLFEHDESFFIRVGGEVLMHSRQHESELELARLGCAHLAGAPEPTILIGGLGLGYTVRQCLDLVGPAATVTVSELMGEVVEWNRTHLGALADHPLKDPRVRLEQRDVVAVISEQRNRFDAILLDVDNGPSAMTKATNSRLYSGAGIQACCRALKPKGCLAVWSAESSKPYEHALVRAGLAVRRYTVPAYKNSKSESRFIWVASTDKNNLPPGGGEPRMPPPKRKPPPRRRRS